MFFPYNQSVIVVWDTKVQASSSTIYSSHFHFSPRIGVHSVLCFYSLKQLFWEEGKRVWIPQILPVSLIFVILIIKPRSFQSNSQSIRLVYESKRYAVIDLFILLQDQLSLQFLSKSNQNATLPQNEILATALTKSQFFLAAALFGGT